MRSRLLLLLALVLVAAAACGDDDSVFSSSTTAPVTTTGAGTTTVATTSTTAATTTTAAITVTTLAPPTTADPVTGGGPDTPDELVDAFTTRLVETGDPFDEESARCFAQGVVDEVGFDRLVSLGAIEPGADPEEVFSQLDEDEVDIVADLGLTCLDVHAMFVEQFEGLGMTNEVAVCIADGVAGAPFLHDMIVASMLGEEYDPMTDPEASALIFALVTQCMSG